MKSSNQRADYATQCCILGHAALRRRTGRLLCPGQPMGARRRALVKAGLWLRPWAASALTRARPPASLLTMQSMRRVWPNSWDHPHEFQKRLFVAYRSSRRLALRGNACRPRMASASGKIISIRKLPVKGLRKTGRRFGPA